jgi:hypothetical protein
MCGLSVALEAPDRLATELYAVGWQGEIWHYDGEKWHQLPSPTKLVLVDVCCAGDGTVYACGREGLLLKGRDQTWEIVEPPGTPQVCGASRGWTAGGCSTQRRTAATCVKASASTFAIAAVIACSEQDLMAARTCGTFALGRTQTLAAARSMRRYRMRAPLARVRSMSL